MKDCIGDDEMSKNVINEYLIEEIKVRMTTQQARRWNSAQKSGDMSKLLPNDLRTIRVYNYNHRRSWTIKFFLDDNITRPLRGYNAKLIKRNVGKNK